MPIVAANALGRPSREVAVFRLPMPMEGVSEIARLIERLYGSGESFIRFDGDVLRIIEPDGGFGERTPAIEEDDFQLADVTVSDDHVSVEIMSGEEVLSRIAVLLDEYMTTLGAANYVEMQMRTSEDEPFEYTFRLQRFSGSTPHALREEAEAEVARLTKENEELRARLGESASSEQ